MHSAIYKILVRRFGGERLVSRNAEGNSWPARRAQAQFIVQRDGLKNGAEFVKSIGAFPKDIQAEIDFCERGNADFGHALDYGFASVAVDFCATRCFDCE